MLLKAFRITDGRMRYTSAYATKERQVAWKETRDMIAGVATERIGNTGIN